ncbi:NAD(P)-dependent oxidoreductase [Fundicoccus culcitae]|uniref:NAD(P)-dependent oxidoreductase n=1 Tax=Fundicoccus culcitae TaxID=2969821 RepID=A0ABY5P7K5_9LACT|nr:NAD(P)-dependent oxidoreductase [Fundicoccus culcitae]UUX34703.1 NAD(P)-dependent oxidoreductase [Fundicoccus culcitae]
MKLAVIAANGKAGKLIVSEALSRGMEVTAIARGENETEATEYLQKDLFDLTKEDLEGFDVVATAFGAFTPETLPGHLTSIEHLTQLLAGSDTRFIVVGGAGSLYMDETHTVELKDTPDFPDAFMPTAINMGKGLDALRQATDVKWTYISPAADFQADGERTGEYLLGGEEFFVNDKGESTISYADYAIAFVDEIEKGNHIQERISVIAK